MTTVPSAPGRMVDGALRSQVGRRARTASPRGGGEMRLGSSAVMTLALYLWDGAGRSAVVPLPALVAPLQAHPSAATSTREYGGGSGTLMGQPPACGDCVKLCLAGRFRHAAATAEW